MHLTKLRRFRAKLAKGLQVYFASRKRGPEKGRKGDRFIFPMRRYILMEVLCLKILAKVNCRVRFLEI